jgi:plastocyanin
MRSVTSFTVVLALLAGLVLPTTAVAARKAPAVPAQTYTITVGWENPSQGVGINAFYPEAVTIHRGDTVRWVQNSNEIHTVTFLAGTSPASLIIPAASGGPSPLLFNPVAVNPAVPTGGRYDGSTYANSGLMGRESGQFRDFSLTFTTKGTFNYLCLVHGTMMSGQVVVVDPGTRIPSPYQVKAEGWQQMAEDQAQVPAVIQAAQSQIKPPVENPDGTLTHHVLIGYSDGPIDLMRFFPDTLKVSPGDTVVWEMSSSNMAPHTVTFLNGQPEPDLVIPVSQPGGPPLLYANPAVFFPYQPAAELVRNGIYNSGVMDPVPGTTYTLVIGDMAPGWLPYLCLLHDTSGMKATLWVFPEFKEPSFPMGEWPWLQIP